MPRPPSAAAVVQPAAAAPSPLEAVDAVPDEQPRPGVGRAGQVGAGHALALAVGGVVAVG